MANMDLTSLKESETVEFKEQFNDSALKTLAAFVNTKGGSLYVGVKDDATLLSEGITDKVQQNVVSKTMNILGITPEVILHNYEGNDFLEVKVKQQRPPVSVRGTYYQRVGNTTREVTGDALKQLFLEGESWDSITNEQFGLEDIDNEEVINFVQSAKQEGRISSDFEDENVKTILQGLGLWVQGQLTNAAILLFGKNPQKYFPNAVVRVGRFRDESTIVADRTVSGNLFNQANEAEEQIKSLINRRYEITDKSFERRDIWQYPLAAIREALLNALVHRNYFEMGVKIQIKIYDNMLWIFNPGKLPGALRVEDLKKPHASYPRNRLLTSTFYRSGLIEELGSGIQRMTDAMRKENLPEPEFEEQGEVFVAKLIGDFVTVFERILDIELTDRHKEIIRFAQNGEFKISDIANQFYDIHKRTLRRDIKQLVELEVLQSEGEKRGRTYSIKRP